MKPVSANQNQKPLEAGFTKPKPPTSIQSSMKTLLTIAVVTFVATSSALAANHERSSQPAQVSGHTTEVRYTAGPSIRKASKPTKLIITRDANGKIISVKRG